MRGIFVEEITLLEEELKTEENILRKIDIMNKLSYKLSGFDGNRSIEIANEAAELSRQAGYKNGYAESAYMTAYTYRKLSNFTNGIKYLNLALKLFLELSNEDGIMRAYNLLGIYNYYYSEYEKALNYFNKSLKLAVKHNNNFIRSSVYNNIGEIFRDIKNYDSAIDYYKKCYDIVGKNGDKMVIGSVRLNMGLINIERGYYTDAILCFNEAYDFFKDINEIMYQAASLNKIGEAYFCLGNDEMALEYYLKSKEAFSRQDNLFYEIELLINFGKYYLKRKDKVNTKYYFYKALEYSIKINADGSMAKCYHYISKYYEETDDFKMALESYKQFYEIEKKVENENLKKNMFKLSLQLKVEKAEKQAEIYKNKNKQLQSLSFRDALTNLYNRTFFKIVLQSLKIDNIQFVGVISCDLDCLKKVNDTYGHLYGDKYIQTAGEILKEASKEKNLIFRIGGDEFIVMCFNKTEDYVKQLLDNIKSCEKFIEIEKAQENIDLDNFIKIKVEISAGYFWSNNIESMEQIIHKADKKMYADKFCHRN
ncbi:MAG: diguanylate cyclase protein [Clostridiaceae bacterium]|jgi:diguanylate cyclase (GGDEF)-like protein|nr:diguanylate cyclase protein [Clostridiaceae bacterium]